MTQFETIMSHGVAAVHDSVCEYRVAGSGVKCEHFQHAESAGSKGSQEASTALGALRAKFWQCECRVLAELHQVFETVY